MSVVYLQPNPEGACTSYAAPIMRQMSASISYVFVPAYQIFQKIDN